MGGGGAAAHCPPPCTPTAATAKIRLIICICSVNTSMTGSTICFRDSQPFLLSSSFSAAEPEPPLFFYFADISNVNGKSRFNPYL